MSDYPKVIDIDGLNVTVADEVEEARWRATPAAVGPASPDAPVPDPSPAPAAEVAPEPEPASPLDDVTVDMDNPEFAEKSKKSAKKK